MLRSEEPDHDGYVYLLHFGRKHYHARHYVGYSGDYRYRLIDHVRGAGSPLVYAVARSGNPIILSVIWKDAPRELEKEIKRRRNHKFYCPWCDNRRRNRERLVPVIPGVISPVWVGGIEINSLREVDWWDQWTELNSI